MISPSGYGVAAAAALVAGAINALAGGGTLISFPALTTIGLPDLVANVTSTLALAPGYFGAGLAQRHDLRGQGRRLRLLLPAAALGGLVGALLLLASDEALFRRLVPWLILTGALLLAAQEPLRNRWQRLQCNKWRRPLRNQWERPLRNRWQRLLCNQWQRLRCNQWQPPLRSAGPDPLVPPAAASSGRERWSVVPVFLASIYGGYFGAGLSVILLASLALTLEDNLTRLNALKQSLALVANLAAAALFLLAGPVQVPVVLVMAVAALVGGGLGGALASRIDPLALRRLVVALGVVVALILFLR